MKYLHTMVRITDIEASLAFYCGALGLHETRRITSEARRFTLIFVAAPESPDAEIELTHLWDPQPNEGGRNFGHIAFQVDDIYAMCERLMTKGVTINRPPVEGRMAVVLSPDGISIELLQKGAPLPPAEPWLSMPQTGTW